MQKEGLPMGAAADFHALSRTSDLLSQIVKPLLNSSKDFSPLGNSFQRPSSAHIFLTLLSSLFISLFSSQLLWTPVDSPHLSSTCPIFLSPVEVTQLQTFVFRPVEVPFHSMWFQHSIVLSFSCHVLSFDPTGLLTVTCGSNVQARLGRSIFSTRAKSCDVTSRHLSRAHVTWAAQPHASLSPAAWKAKRTRTRKQHSCARHRNAAKRGKRRQHSRAVRFSSLLLSATRPKCRHRNTACARSPGDRNAEKRPLDAQFLHVRRPKERMAFQRKAFAKREAQQWLRQRHVPQILFEKIAPPQREDFELVW